MVHRIFDQQINNDLDYYRLELFKFLLDGENFKAMLDVSDLKEEELYIQFIEGNKMKFGYKREFRKVGDCIYSQDSSYVFLLPENIMPNNLVIFWDKNDLLLIITKKHVTEILDKLEKDFQRENSKEKLHSSVSNKDQGEKSREISGYPVANNDQGEKSKVTTHSSISSNDQGENANLNATSSNESRTTEENLLNEKKSSSAAESSSEQREIRIIANAFGQISDSLVSSNDQGENVNLNATSSNESRTTEENLLNEKKSSSEQGEIRIIANAFGQIANSYGQIPDSLVSSNDQRENVNLNATSSNESRTTEENLLNEKKSSSEQGEIRLIANAFGQIANSYGQISESLAQIAKSKQLAKLLNVIDENCEKPMLEIKSESALIEIKSESALIEISEKKKENPPKAHRIIGEMTILEHGEAKGSKIKVEMPKQYANLENYVVIDGS